MVINEEEFKKKDESRSENEEGNTKITEEIELKNELFQVKGSLKKNITQDYTLAHLNKDEREFIIENYQNAEFGKSIIERYANKGWRYVWDEDKMDWKKDKDGVYIKELISNEERKYIQKLANRTFEFFMIRPHMIAILNRNKSDNFLVKLLGKSNDEDEENKPMAMLDQKSFIEKIRDNLGRNEGGSE